MSKEEIIFYTPFIIAFLCFFGIVIFTSLRMIKDLTQELKRIKTNKKQDFK